MTKRIQWLAFIAAAIILVIAFIISRQMMADYANRPIIKREVPVIRPDVSVLNVETSRYQAIVSVFGAANPKFNVTLSAQAAGQVEQLSAKFETGLRVPKGATLATLENSDYLAAVAEAKQQVAEAELLFMQEQRQGQQAAAEWQASGLGGKPDDLVLRKPQLAQTQATV
ncbi:MAG: efflux transporter periplasmic adaptor subunit, partial [Methylophaga sp.]